ncbi:hypothetical protein [Singulisphaera sp. PoT]|uniref:hypothetical protein n=1 Tax=Singulisphaera sp. PoT TaxID=3411797 RepID=UPI003BF52801
MSIDSNIPANDIAPFQAGDAPASVPPLGGKTVGDGGWRRVGLAHRFSLWLSLFVGGVYPAGKGRFDSSKKV